MAITGSRVAAVMGLILAGGLAHAYAQCPTTSPDFSPDFSGLANQSCLSLNENGGTLPSFTAGQSSSSNSIVLRLTPAQGGLATSAWYNTPQTVTNGFSTTFAFQVGSTTSYDADGFAFVIQSSSLSALAPGGCGMGFGSSSSGCATGTGISNSIAIEFNTYNNGLPTDPNSGDDIAIQTCGVNPNVVDVSSTCSLKHVDLTGKITLTDGAVHVATVNYTPSTASTCGNGTQSCSTIDVILDGTDLFPGGVLFNMSSIFSSANSTSAFVGFTAGTGGGNDDQDIVSWTFTPTAQSQTGTVSPTQTTPTTFNIDGGFSAGSPTTGYDFTAQEQSTTTNPVTLQMVVTAIPISQTACNALVNKNPLFANAQCFVYQNGGGQGNDTSVLFEVTCPPTGSCGSTSNPFNADLGTDFSFNCSPIPPIENLPLQCGTPFAQPFTFGFPNYTSINGLPSVGFLKGEGPDAVHPCSPDPTGATYPFTSNQIESFSLGDTSGGAKGGSGGTTSCWVMTYQTYPSPGEAPSIAVTQPASGATYTQGQATTASFTCTPLNAGATSPTGPYLTLASCTATQTPGSSVANGSPFDTSTLGVHTFTVQAEDSALNTSQVVNTYTVTAPPVISGPSNATFAVGTASSVIFSATGYPVPSFSETGALPNGVTFVDNKNGTATLSGTATVSGIFPITIGAQNAAGSPATLPFTLTAAASVPASGKCNGVYEGTYKGNLTVSTGQTCIFVAGGVTGNIVENGGKLVLSGASVGGNFQDNGGTFSVGPGVTIKGNFSVLEPPKSTVQSTVCGASIGGDLQVLESGTPVVIGSGTSSCAGNTITGSLNVSGNNATTSIYNNTVGGSLLDLANAKPTQVFSNHIGGSLSCLADSTITGGGNTAILKLGQCAKF